MTQPVPQPPETQPKKSQSRYTGPIRLLIGLNVLLVAIAIMLGINMFSGPPSPDAALDQDTGLASESGEVLDPLSAQPEQEQPAQGSPDPDLTGAIEFASPSKNIVCEVSAVGARCDITVIDAPVQNNPSGCAGSVGHVVTLTAQGTDTPCIGSLDGPKTATSTHEELGYGEQVGVNNYLCTSERSGVTCSDTTTNRGFSLARAGIKTF